MMDWDSHRYLECFFAVPMMGAVLHTVNVRISPDQILYTINHAADDVILVNAEFLPILEAIHDKIRPGSSSCSSTTGPAAPQSKLTFAAEYEAMLAAASPSFAFPDLPEDTRATTFYTTGTTGLPKGRLLQPPPARPAHARQRRGARQRDACDVHRSRTCTCR